MKHKVIPTTLALAILIITLSLSNVTTSAQSGGTYDLTWNTIDGGGGMFSTGGIYELGGTIGQPDAGAMNGGTFSLAGGFWGRFTQLSGSSNYIFLPFIRK